RSRARSRDRRAGGRRPHLPASRRFAPRGGSSERRFPPRRPRSPRPPRGRAGTSRGRSRKVPRSARLPWSTPSALDSPNGDSIRRSTLRLGSLAVELSDRALTRILVVAPVLELGAVPDAPRADMVEADLADELR